MRKSLGFVVLMVGLLTMVSLFGCGQQTTPAPSPGSSDSAAKAGAAAGDAVKAAIGVAEISSSMGALTGAMPTGFSVKSLSSSTVPDAFFKPVPADGWITVEGVSLVTGETVQIRLYTVGGQVIDSSYLASKKIASLEALWGKLVEGTFSFESFVSSFISWLNYPTDWNGEDPASRSNFYSNPNKYNTLLSLWDYIAWAYIAGNSSVEALEDIAWKMYPVYQVPPKPPRPSLMGGYPALGTPEAQASDCIGTQEARITGTHPDGSTISLTLTVSTDASGKPVSATGAGTITRADGVVMTFTCTMNFSNGAPTGGTMDVVVGSPDNLHMVMTISAGGGASGTVYSTATTPETEIGTVVIYATPDASGHHGYYEDKATGNKTYF